MHSFFSICCICVSVLMLAPKGYGVPAGTAERVKEELISEELAYPERIIRKDTLPDGSLTLSTPLAVYENDKGQVVYMVGAVHIGEKEYYEELNKRFSGYDAVLFEMVGGEKMQRVLELKKRKKTGVISEEENKELAELNNYLKKEKEKENGFFRLLAGQYERIASLMGVSSQKDGIDYSPSHFIHADMTREEMDQAQKAKGESMFGLMIAGMFKSLTTPEPDSSPNMITLIDAVQREDKGALKKIFIEMMEAQVGNELLGNSVILEGRNDKCLSVFDKVVQEKPEFKKIGIFYGSAHLPDLHGKLEKRGYHLRSVEWIPAWKTAMKQDVPTPVSSSASVR